MLKIARIQMLVVAILLVLITAFAKAPHVQLLMGVLSGKRDYRAVPVQEFTAPAFCEPTVRIRVGSLSLCVPLPALPQNADQDDWGYWTDELIRLRYKGVTLFARAPRPDDLPRYADVLEPDYASEFADSITLIAAAYRADARSLRFSMSRQEARSLQQLLEVRRILHNGVERVEVVREGQLKGVLLIDPLEDGRRRMCLDYYAKDEQRSGMAILLVEPESEQAMDLARAMVGSFRLDHLPPPIAGSLGPESIPGQSVPHAPGRG
jgi:hypothetical protein